MSNSCEMMAVTSHDQIELFFLLCSDGGFLKNNTSILLWKPVVLTCQQPFQIYPPWCVGSLSWKCCLSYWTHCWTNVLWHTAPNTTAYFITWWPLKDHTIRTNMTGQNCSYNCSCQFLTIMSATCVDISLMHLYHFAFLALPSSCNNAVLMMQPVSLLHAQC